MLRATGQMVTVLYYEPTDSQNTFKIRHPDGLVQWLPAAAVAQYEAIPPGPGASEGEDPQPQGAREARQISLEEPLLGADRRWRDLGSSGGLMWLVQCLLSLGLAGATIALAWERNSHCDPDALLGVEPAFGGDLLPPRFFLSERRQYVSLSKVVDVFDEDWSYLGYFYDMNLLFWMRFGFSDASDRIWFEARYPTFLSRIFQFQIQYYLQRCDVGAGGRTGGIFDLVEDIWQEPWFCISNCLKLFHVFRRSVGPSDYGQAGGNVLIADVVFNSTLQWFHKNMLLPGARHEWYMNMTNPADGSTIAWARQEFHPWNRGMLGTVLLSNWTVAINEDLRLLPNWVIAFMAALDDVEEHEAK
mmetsp:Transcript_7875/g.14282  ORF Transcript_7875/g.14282 Transcript_7875/m.14282 type:complete len:359 (+) Transcript_7875:1-1077(+)